MQATYTIVAQVTNERADCNKLGTYYKFKRYEQHINEKQQYSCLGHRFSKHKMTRYAKNMEGMTSLLPIWLRSW